MRARNQRPGQGFEVSVSKTVDMPTLEAWRAFVEPKRRAEWLDLALRMRTGTRTMGRSARFDVQSEGTRVNVYFDAKGETATVVTVTHVKLEAPMTLRPIGRIGGGAWIDWPPCPAPRKSRPERSQAS